jgi:hypothetical protein
MKKILFVFLLMVAALAGSALAQNAPNSATPSPPPLQPEVEKELAAKASNVTEVTLGKNMLGFAAKFMDKKDPNDVAAQQLIENLDGIYVRDYEFEKEGEYSAEDVDKLRQSFETSEWTSIVREREKKSGESTDVMMKMVNGQSQGMFVLSAEPKELTVVLILGPIRMDQLGALSGLGGLGALADVAKDAKNDKGDGTTQKGGAQ